MLNVNKNVEKKKVKGKIGIVNDKSLILGI